MHIGEREIGPGASPYLIAEIGVNHDGIADRALELTRQALRNGADAVKYQLFKADLLMSRAAKLAAYQKSAGERDPVEMLRRLELSIDDMAPCVRLAHDQGKHAIVTVFSLELVDAAERLPWDAYKTASPDIINRPLLDAVAATGKPLVISTGASTLQEVGRALTWLRGARSRVAVMQCVSAYPTPMDQAELGGIAAIRDIFDGPVGYSDHTPDVETGGDAVFHGACLLEKHLTLDKKLPGPDHAASLTPAEFAAYHDVATVGPALVSRVRTSGAGKRVLPIEEDVRRVSRQSLVTTRALGAGEIITRADLTIKRPGTGLEPFRLDEVIGKATARAVESDMPLLHADMGWEGRSGAGREAGPGREA